MSFQGHIENGAVVLDNPVLLPNGTIVRIEPVEASKNKPESLGPVVADTDQSYSMQQMAQVWSSVAKPIPEEETPLAVDPDDYL